MADNIAVTAGTGTTVSTEETTTLNGGTVSAQHVQRVASAIRTADATVVDLPGDAANGLDVDVTRSALPSGASTSAKQDTGNTSLSSIDTKLTDVATQTTLALIKAKTDNLDTALSGVKSGTDKLVTAKTADFDTGAGTDTVQMFGIALPKSGGAVAGGTSSDPIRVDPTGTTTQPVSGTVTVQQSTASSLKVDLSGTAANSTAIKVDGSAVTQPVSGTITANAGSGTFTTKETRSTTPSQSSVAGSASSVSLLASNSNRLGATIFNDSTAALYIKLGATASTTSFTIKLSQDDYYEVPFGYTGAIDGIWASATGNARITELT